jgi:zinc transport system permease protein
MSEFLQAALSHSFMQNALLAGLLAAIACGITGTYVVVKRIGYITGGISHSVLGGMGVAYFFRANPLYGAIAAAIFAALIIGIISLKAKQHEDTIIGALWAVGMAVGIIFISRTPGYNVDLMSYLFGNILMVSRENILLIAILDITIILIVYLFYKRFLAVSFDEEHSTLQGINVAFTYLLLLCIIALTVVILIQVVGLILVIALITLPASIAAHYTNSLKTMMLWASIIGIVLTTGGLALSYEPDFPSGSVIVLLAGALYIMSVIIQRPLKKLLRKKS